MSLNEFAENWLIGLAVAAFGIITCAFIKLAVDYPDLLWIALVLVLTIWAIFRVTRAPTTTEEIK